MFKFLSRSIMLIISIPVFLYLSLLGRVVYSDVACWVKSRDVVPLAESYTFDTVSIKIVTAEQSDRESGEDYFGGNTCKLGQRASIQVVPAGYPFSIIDDNYPEIPFFVSAGKTENFDQMFKNCPHDLVEIPVQNAQVLKYTPGETLDCFILSGLPWGEIVFIKDDTNVLKIIPSNPIYRFSNRDDGVVYSYNNEDKTIQFSTSPEDVKIYCSPENYAESPYVVYSEGDWC